MGGDWLADYHLTTRPGRGAEGLTQAKVGKGRSGMGGLT